MNKWRGLLYGSGDYVLVWFFIIAFRLASVELGQFMNNATLVWWHHFERMAFTGHLWLINRNTHIWFTHNCLSTEGMKEGKNDGWKIGRMEEQNEWRNKGRRERIEEGKQDGKKKWEKKDGGMERMEERNKGRREGIKGRRWGGKNERGEEGWRHGNNGDKGRMERMKERNTGRKEDWIKGRMGKEKETNGLMGKKSEEGRKNGVRFG